MTTATAKTKPDDIITMVPGSPELTIEREFDAPATKVFTAWTTTEGLRAWMGPDGFTAPDSICDARVGGAFCIPIQGPEGSLNTARGIYHVVDAPNLLVFTWQWDQEDGSDGREMLITIKLEDLGGRTRLSLHQVNFIDEDARDKHRSGWNGCLNGLEEYLAE